MLETPLKAHAIQTPCPTRQIKISARGSKQFETSKVNFSSLKHSTDLPNPYHFEKFYQRRNLPCKSGRNTQNDKNLEYQEEQEDKKQLTYTLRCASPYGVGLCPQAEACKVRGTRACGSEVNL